MTVTTIDFQTFARDAFSGSNSGILGFNRQADQTNQKEVRVEGNDSFAKKHADEMAKVVKPTVLVCGYTGSGSVKAAAAPVVAQVAGVMAASSLTKLFPGFGSIIQAGVAFTLSEVIGQVVGAWMIRCCEARIKGLPMPDFQLPFESLAHALKAHQKK